MKKIMVVVLGLCCVSSYPEGLHFEGESTEHFVNRWSFQALCDHHFDPRYVWPTPTKNDKLVSFNPRDVKPGDMVFVRDFDYYFNHKHEKIKVPYFILTHGEYLDSFKEDYLPYLDDGRILAWFTIHPCAIEHERVIPIPLGVIQYKKMYDKRKKTATHLLKLRNRKKKKLVYKNFTEWRMPERTRIRKLFEGTSFCTFGEPCEFRQYISELAEHKFVLSPPGLGPDCYRVWESLLVGTIPIVQHSHMDGLYEGLPVLFVDAWEDISQDFLEKEYQKIIRKSYSQENLFMEYWVAVIDNVRKKYWPRESDTFYSLRNRMQEIFRSTKSGYVY